MIEKMKPAINPYFKGGPYTAKPANPNRIVEHPLDWWYVESGKGFNCLIFLQENGNKYGMIFTSQHHALELAEEWNRGGE